MNRFVIAVTVLFAATAANAQIYQWKDENGKTVMSDIPPVGHVRQQRKIETDASTPKASNPKSTADRDLEFRKRQKESQERADKESKEQSANSDRKENCEAARRHLLVLESGERIALRDDKGERYFMEDAQREQETTKARQNIQSLCK